MAQTSGLVNTAAALVNIAATSGLVPFAQGRQAELIDSPLHLPCYNQCISGQMFAQTNAIAGGTIPIYTTTAIGAASITAMPIWNTSTNRNVVLVSTSIARISGTTGFGSVFLAGRTGMGTTAGTGSPFAAFLTTAPRNTYLGQGAASAVSSYGGVAAASCTLTTATAAADILQVLFNMNLEADSATAHQILPSIFSYNGSIIIPPGAAVWVVSTVASTALFNITHVWYEAPIPQ